MTNDFTHAPAGRGPHHLMLGTVTVSRLLGGDETDGRLPDEPPPVDRERLLAAFEKHGLTPYSFPGAAQRSISADT